MKTSFNFKSPNFKRKLLAQFVVVSMTGAVLAPTIAWAQTSNATLRGQAAANTVVTAKNVATGAMRTTHSAADGSYALVGLPPGTYQVDAGAGTAHTVTLTVASTATLNLAAPAAAANATNLGAVTVSATTLQEVKTPEVGSTISLHQINTIPQVSRNFLEFADTVPGMVFTLNSQGNTSLRGGAMNDSSTNVYIDGVGQKSYVKEGGVSGQNASQGNPFPQSAIGEYKVITSNYKAEYDQVSSAAVVAQTKSGTNEFHGAVFGDFTNSSMRARTAGEKASGEKAVSRNKEYGASLGGPIIQDKLHFFVAFEGKQFTTPVQVTPGGPAGIASALPPAVQAEIGPSNLPFKEDLYFGKIDWEPTTTDRFELSAQRRAEKQLQFIPSGNAASTATATLNYDTRYDIRWQHSGAAYFNELLFTHENAYNNPTPVNYGNSSLYNYSSAPGSDQTILVVGPANALATQKKGQKGPALQDDLTFNDFEWHGDHVIKLGAKYKEITLNAQDAGFNNPQFKYNVTPAGTDAQPYGVFFPYLRPGYSPAVTTKDKQFGAYVQDDWAVNDKLTLNLGVRWDYEKDPSYLNYVTPQGVIDALNGPDPNAPGQSYAQSLARGGVDVNDYISNGHNRKAYKGEIQPRLGFSYDLNGDEKHVIFGGAGRAYDRDLYDYLEVEQTKAALPQINYYFQDANGQCHNNNTPCIPWNPAYLNGLSALTPLVANNFNGQEVDMINNKLKPPHSDQFSLGMRNKLGEWNTSATVARILSYDGFAFTLGNRYPDGSYFNNPQLCNPTAKPPTNSTAFGCPIPGYSSMIIGNNGIRTRTTQVLLSAEKPYTKESGWYASFAYTYTRAFQNRDINEHYSFDEPTIGQYPFILSNAAAKHRLVATGSIDAPYGITLSAKLTLATPLPYNSSGFCYVQPPDGVQPGNYFPNGSTCIPRGYDTPGTGRFLVGGKVFGFRDIDVSAQKDLYLPGSTHAYIKLSMLNLFNWQNFQDYSTFNNGTFNGYAAAYTKTGNILFVPRTVKLQAGLDF